ncbi:hypothetical protein TYRP_007536 [Tyrophagus putrescentiae]|nr:hypothetical protein TYRP_007536 [Tyrophagus putrescentiae]
MSNQITFSQFAELSDGVGLQLAGWLLPLSCGCHFQFLTFPIPVPFPWLKFIRRGADQLI